MLKRGSVHFSSRSIVFQCGNAESGAGACQRRVKNSLSQRLFHNENFKDVPCNHRPSCYFSLILSFLTGLILLHLKEGGGGGMWAAET